MIIGSLHRRPLILIGDGWQSVFDQVFTQLDGYTPAYQREMLIFAKDIHTAVNQLEGWQV
jgi:hypothetical protein